MHLKKLFNFKYLYQNFKKSKSILIFLLCASFFINVWIVGTNLISGNLIINFNSLSNISSVISFILPVILAYSLFGFLFKKKEIDFIMSKPISRRQIYITNIFGGILYIFVVILLNTLGFILLSLFTDLFIPMALIFDYFIFWLFTYIFIFIISILSMSISGSRIGSLVIVLLILLLYPTFTLIDYSLKINSDLSISICSNGDCLDNINTMFTKVFTTPIDYYNHGFSNYSLIKTIILTIIYVMIGYFIFKHRKMENVDVSFSSNIVYQVIKLLVFIPVTYFSYYLWMSDKLFLLVSVIICIGFYFIYDLIMKKELKNIFKLVLELFTFSALYIGIYFVVGLYYNHSEKNLSIPDEVCVDAYIYQGFSNFSQLVKVTDKDLINELIFSDDLPEYNNQVEIYLSNKYYINKNISDELYEKMLDNGEYKLDFTANNILHITSSLNTRTTIPVSYEGNKLIVNHLDDDYISSNEINDYITIYTYDNHLLKELSFDIGNNINLLNYVKNYLNDAFINNFDGNIFGGDDKLPEGYSIIIRKHNKEFLKYLEEHKYDILTDDYIKLYSNLDRYYINRSSLEEFLKEYDVLDVGENN